MFPIPAPPATMVYATKPVNEQQGKEEKYPPPPYPSYALVQATVDCVRTACILRTHRPGYSSKNTCHLSGSTAKQQSPNENNETAFNLVLHCPYAQPTQTCIVRLCRGMQDAHMFRLCTLY